MRLTDLSPVWLNDHVFAFKCPHCQRFWVTCKDAVMTHQEQFDLYEKEFGPDWNLVVIPSRPDFAWRISSRDFSWMTVTPSIDASPSGCWHGHITDGAIA